jgi:hypothetical protein
MRRPNVTRTPAARPPALPSIRLLSLACALAVFALTPISAAAQDNGTLTLEVENDFFAPATNTDRHYTNGVRAAWLSGPLSAPDWVADASDTLSPFGSDAAPATRRFGVAIGQNIFTPDDTTRADPDPNDRPYAGWLYVAASLSSVRQSPAGAARQDTLQVDLGVVGPSALGEEVQNNFHNLINVGRARGWSHQLKDEPTLGITVQQQWRTDRFPAVFGLQADAIPHVIATLGNAFTYLGAGGTLRLGFSLPDDFGPPRIRPGLPGSDSFARTGPVSWYAFLGLEGRLVGRNIFLDGNTFRDSPSVDKRILVGDFQAGLAVVFGSVRLTYTHVLVTPEFVGQSNWDQLGSLSLSWNL